jgi:hypothetical protein
MARIEVPALPYAEAHEWLGTSSGIPAHGATLAELYALREGYAESIGSEPAPSGQYL